MRVFTATELTRMQSTQDTAMQDRCQVGVYTAPTSDDYALPVAVYTYGSAIVCGVEHVNPQEEHASGEVPVIDARLRLPIGTSIDERNRIKITRRYGSELSTPQVFEIEGPVKRGPSGLVLDLRVVDDGSS